MALSSVHKLIVTTALASPLDRVRNFAEQVASGLGSRIDAIEQGGALLSRVRTIARTATTAGQTVFDIGIEYDPNLISVFRAGRLLMRGDDYIANGGTQVVMTRGAMIGDGFQFVTALTPSAYDQLNPPVWVASREEVKAFPVGADKVVSLTEDGRDGVFVCRFGIIPNDPLEGMYFQSDTPGYYWARIWDGIYCKAKWFGAIGNGIFDDTLAINAALDFVGVLGGGTVVLPAGTYRVSNSNPSPAHWENRRAVYIKYSNVHLMGAGVGATTLVLADGTDAHVLNIGNRGISGEPKIVCNNVRISDMTIDGNRSTQSPPVIGEDHWAGINVCNNADTGLVCKGVILERLRIHDIQYYGIGFQRNAFEDCAVRNVLIEDVNADGIDCKGDDDKASTNNVIDNVTVRRYGGGAALNGQAGIDLRQGWIATNVDVSEPEVSAQVGLRIQNGESGATPRTPTQFKNFRATGASVSGSSGVRIISRWGSATDGICDRWGDGLSCSDPEGRIQNVKSVSCVSAGFRLWQNATAGVKSDLAALVGCTSRDNNAGVVVDGAGEINLFSCDFRNNNIGLDIRSGSTNVRMVGGSLTGNNTQVSDNGGSTQIIAVSGYRTKGKALVSFPIGSSGVKVIEAPHGLPFTPAIGDVLVSIIQNTAVDDFEIGFTKVVSADATNITVKVNVVTPSANAAAAAFLRVFVEAYQ